MWKKHWRFGVLASVGFAALLMLTAVFVRTQMQREPELLQPAPQIEAASLPEPDVVQEAPAYTVGIWQGRVAVFEQGADTPVTVLETPVISLPDADQTALAQGIPVNDREELAGLMEDYGS